MAKIMAYLSGSIVENVLWCADWEAETETLIDCSGRPVHIGDTYTDGGFYRDGAPVRTALEELQLRLEEADGIIAELVEMIYEADMEVIG